VAIANWMSFHEQINREFRCHYDLEPYRDFRDGRGMFCVRRQAAATKRYLVHVR